MFEWFNGRTGGGCNDLVHAERGWRLSKRQSSKSTRWTAQRVDHHHSIIVGTILVVHRRRLPALHYPALQSVDHPSLTFHALYTTKTPDIVSSSLVVASSSTLC